MNSRMEKDRPLDFELSLTKGEALVLGATVNASIRRRSDDFYWDSSGGTFLNTTYREDAMTELTGDNGIEGRYVFAIPATNKEDVYFFRARFTFAGDAFVTVFEIEVETYSELVSTPFVISAALPGDSVRLIGHLQEGGLPLTGKSPKIVIQRISDNRYWTGVIWSVTFTELPMIEQVGNVALEGEYRHLFTVPLLPVTETYTWSIKYVGNPSQYLKGQIRISDVNVARIATSETVANNFAAAIKTVVRGIVVAGTLTVTEMTVDLSEQTDDQYRGRALYWETGLLEDVQTEILAYDGTSTPKKLTYKQVPQSPAIGDKFVIV